MSRAKRKIKSVGRIILLVVISLFIGIKVYNWNAQTLAGNAMPMPFGWGISVVLSGSMEDALSVNDLVIVRTQSSYKVNDIVVYQDGNSLVIHRIIRIEKDEVITQGDANNIADSPVPVSAIKGKAVAHIPFAGAVMRFLKTPVGTVILIIAAILLLALPGFWERKKAEEEKEKIKEEIRRLKSDLSR